MIYYVENVSIRRRDLDGLEIELTYDDRQFQIQIDRTSGASWNKTVRDASGIIGGCITTLLINESIKSPSGYRHFICKCHYGWSDGRGCHWIKQCTDDIKHIYDWVIKLFN